MYAWGSEITIWHAKQTFSKEKRRDCFHSSPFGERIHADITLFIGKILYVCRGKKFLFFQNTLEILKAAVLIWNLSSSAQVSYFPLPQSSFLVVVYWFVFGDIFPVDLAAFAFHKLQQPCFNTVRMQMIFLCSHQ